MERPILFSGPMVRGLLEGRKTQTRRVVKLPDDRGAWEPSTIGGTGVRTALGEGVPAQCCIWNTTTGTTIACPYGAPGDRLWVREALRREGDAIAYSADDEFAWDLTRPAQWVWQRDSLPSIHCPRGLSRITLEITGVRIERLQSISGYDVIAEGVDPASFRCPCEVCSMTSALCPGSELGLIQTFVSLWDVINGKRAPWSSNPWVWVVEFKRLAAEERAA